MKKQVMYVVAVVALEASGSVNADLVQVSVIYGPHQHPDGNYNTYRVVARFTDAFDRITAVNGRPDQGYNLVFNADGDLYNQVLFDGLWLNDFPSVYLGGEAWDSYVTIGATTFGSSISFTPDFLGDWGGQPPPWQVILGNQWTEADGAWFFVGKPPEVGSLEDMIEGNDTYDVLIAQFTLEGFFDLRGNIAWLNEDGSHNTPFYTFPTPGALSLFGIAGLCGIRRRRE